MDYTLHKAASRGHANHGWLETWHTFSFANYYNPRRIHFGALRVLNDDVIQGGGGFGLHPHDNMEIITIPLSGILSHTDSMENEHDICSGEVQVMSAGTGLFHAEKNASTTDPVALLQIWLMTDAKGHEPRYAQRAFPADQQKNKWLQLVGAWDSDAPLKIHQNAGFYRTNLEEGKSLSFTPENPAHGIYLFVIDGTIQTEEFMLGRRDGAAILKAKSITLQATVRADVLLIEVPMQS